MSENKRQTKIPLYLVITAPFILQIVLVVGLVGYLSFRNGQQAINSVVNQLRSEITAHIDTHLRNFLSTPHKINQQNLNAMRLGYLDANDADSFERHFWEQIQVFESVSSIYFGNTQGGLVDAGREGAEGSLYVILTEDFTSGPFNKYATDEQGQPTDLLVSVPDFDARIRPWYTQAVEKGQATWGEIYLLFTGQDMAISASQPVYDQSGDLLGVFSTDIFTSQIGNFLKHLEIGQTGQGFIMERSGLLVATSTEEPPFSEPGADEPQRRIKANEIGNLTIRYAAEFLVEQFGDYDDILEGGQFEFDIDGQRQFLQVLPVQDDYGIDWLVVVVIPEADFMAQINANIRTSIMLVIAAAIMAVILGIITARRVASPLSGLIVSARALAEGESPQPIRLSRIRETGDLARSFNEMAGQLSQTLDDLNAEIAMRTQAEATLRESEERYSSLFRNNHSIMLIINPETGEIVDANPAACKYYGWPYEEIRHKKITDINILSAEEVRVEMQRAKMEERNHFLFAHRLADGEIRDVEVYSGPIEIKGGALLYSIIYDVTERREAEKGLHESQRRFREMLENVELIAVILDQDGRIAFCNDYMLNLTGWQRDEVVGMSWFENFIPPEIKNGLHENVFLKTFRNGDVKAHHINEIATRAGERRLISWNNTAFRDLAGNIIGVTSLGEDITARRLAEEQILRRNQELAVLVKTSQRLLGYRERTELLAFIVEEIVKIIPGAEAASLWELDETTTKMIPRAWYGHEDEEISGLELDPNSSLVGLVYRTRQSQIIPNTLQEPAFENLGLSKLDSVQSVIAVPLVARDKVIGTLFADSFSRTEAFTQADQRLLESIAYQAALALENARLFEQVGRHAAELEQRIDERTDELRRRVEESEILNRGMVNLMGDIQTANQQAQNAASRLAIANQELEAFAYSVSHDLSAPLRGIRGFAGILADRHRDGLDEQGQEYLDYVVQAGDQMAVLIADLLEYSRLGRRAAQAVPIDLELIIADVLGSLSETVRQNQAEIILPESYPFVLGDRTPLIQIFSNLFDNALKYRRPDLPPKIELLWREESDYAIIQVIDNGIGIPEEHREQIFTMFQRLHSGDDIPGTGIGLALVRKAVLLLDGEVEVDSAEGGGTAFIVKLPLSSDE